MAPGFLGPGGCVKQCVSPTATSRSLGVCSEGHLRWDSEVPCCSAPCHRALPLGPEPTGPASCPRLSPPVTYNWLMKTTCQSIAPTGGCVAGAPLLCLHPARRLQELTSVLVLCHPTEASPCWGHEAGRRCLSKYLPPPGTPSFLHFTMQTQLVTQTTSSGAVKGPTWPGT